ncbi:LysM domain-containing protein [Alcanivorax sp. S71-1-4]|uniref:LysM peptidoglycan-binding domain-containing protein n=1 Tax=Alcanivorax sp. S71-1-4 TaxID=1177159 RepID=UPI00135CD4A1|nr:LysM peptidoglycan-binding domain-containing protein [Alcanivorax sp. S71-1-4]KAF0809612.1 LysM domain-containing protein [Alcanivorax sp. S71-1-4]
MMKSLLRTLTAGALLAVSGLTAADVALKSDHPEVYYVKAGDTLWDISSAFLHNPWEWPELWHGNQQIDNPHLIYPGDAIRLRYVDGQPQLTVDRAVKIQPDSDGVVRLSPQARELPLAAAIPAIPLGSIQSFLKEALVLSRDELATSPYLVGGQDRRVVFGQGDVVYARDPADQWDDLLQDYGFYRVGTQYVDPDTKEILGYEALQIGRGSVAAHDGEMLTLRVQQSNQDLRAEDRVLSSPERRVQSMFYPSAPETEVNASIIRLFGRLSSVARNDVVVISRGAREGLKEGNVLDVYQRGERVRDQVRNEMIRLPDSKSGTLVLFRVFEKVSYGLVIESTKPIYMNDLVKNPGGL